jgi:hypothetical protein
MFSVMSYLTVSGSKYSGNTTTTVSPAPKPKPVVGSPTPVKQPTYVSGSGRLSYSSSHPVYERRPIYQRGLDEKGFTAFAQKRISGFEEEIGLERTRRESQLAKEIEAKQKRFVARESIARQLEAGSPLQSVVGKIQSKRTGVFEEKVSSKVGSAQKQFETLFESKKETTLKEIEGGQKQFERLEIVGYETVPVGTQTTITTKYTQPEQFASFKETSIPELSGAVKPETKLDTKGIVAISAPADLLLKLRPTWETPRVNVRAGLDLDVKKSFFIPEQPKKVLPSKETFFTLTKAVPGEKIEDLSFSKTVFSGDLTKLDLATRQKLVSVQKGLEKKSMSYDPGLSMPLLLGTSVVKGAYEFGSSVGRLGIEETKSVFGFGVGLGDIILDKPGAREKGTGFTGPVSGSIQGFLKSEASFYEKQGFEKYVGSRTGLLAVAPGAAVAFGGTVIGGMGKEFIDRPISLSGETVGRYLGFKGLLSLPSKIKSGAIRGAEYLGGVERVPIESVTSPKSFASLKLTGKGVPVVGDPSKVVSRGIKSDYSKALRQVYEKVSGKKAPVEPVFTKGITGEGAKAFERITITPKLQFYEPGGSFFGGDLSTFMFGGSQKTYYTLFGLGKKTININRSVTALFTEAKQTVIRKVSKSKIVDFISKAEAKLGFDPSLISPEAVVFRAKKLLSGGRPPKLGPSLLGGKSTYRDVFGAKTEQAFTVPTVKLGVVEPSPMVQAGLTREVDVLVRTFSTQQRLDVPSNIFQKFLGYKAKVVAQVPGGTIEAPLRFAVQDTGLNIAREKAVQALVSKGVSPSIENVDLLLKQKGFDVSGFVEPKSVVERFGGAVRVVSEGQRKYYESFLAKRGVDLSGYYSGATRFNIQPLITPAELSLFRLPRRDSVSSVSRVVSGVSSVFPFSRDNQLSVDSSIVSGSVSRVVSGVSSVSYSFNGVSRGSVRDYSVREDTYFRPSYDVPSYSPLKEPKRDIPYIPRYDIPIPRRPLPPKRFWKRKPVKVEKSVFKIPKFFVAAPKTTSALYKDKRIMNMILPIQTDWLKAMNEFGAKTPKVKTIGLLPGKKSGFKDISRLLFG